MPTPPTTPTTSTSNDEQSISAITLKLPPYWPADPQLWFAQVEARFANRLITNEDTMYSHLIAALAPDIAQEFRD